jgi:hypothetical protein
MRRNILLTGSLMLAATLFNAPVEAADASCRAGGGKIAIVGLTNDQRLICFDETSPQSAFTLGKVTGLVGDTKLVGIDYRPATGDLYGLGDAGGLYVLDTRDGGVTFKAQLNVALSGTSFGVDFNPTVDRMRIISDTGQNLRANVDNGSTTTDTNLANPDPATGVTGAAYTNNDTDPDTGTTLYALDSRLDVLVIQAPPNNGSLNSTGRLSVDTTAAVGFDIYSRTNGGTTTGVDGFLSLVTGGRARLFKVNLFTGRATPRGMFRFQNQVIDIAIPLKQ